MARGWLVVVVMAVLGCGREGAVNRSSVVAWRAQPMSQRSGLGTDCSVGGGNSCLSGVCIHTSPDPSSGRVCSSLCGEDANCPSGWHCVWPGAQALNGACVPPAGFSAQLVAAGAPYSKRIPLADGGIGIISVDGGGV